MADSETLSFLVVDDDDDDFEETRQLLIETELKFRTERVNDPEQALSKILASEAHICFLSHRLTGEQGLGVLQRARAAGSLLPIVLLTGEGDEEVDREALDAGAADYLVKGEISPRQLRRSIRYALRRAENLAGLRRAVEVNELLVSAVEALDVGVIIVSPGASGGRVLYSNSAFTEMTGYTRTELEQEGLGLLVGDRTSPETFERLLEDLERGRSLHQLFAFYRKGGDLFWDEVAVLPVFDNNGDLLGQVHLHTDVTERRKLEQQLNRAARMGAIGRLAGGIAHDFGNFLSIARGYGEILTERLDDPELRGHASNLLDSIDKGAALVNQLLTFGKAEESERRRLDLNDVIADLRPLLESTAGSSVDLRLELSDDLPSIQADPTQLEQILINLAVNARDAMPDGGTLSIETTTVVTDEIRFESFLRPGGYVSLSVTDTGIGMDDETADRIFEPFFTTKGNEGTGMGLSTVYAIATQDGGDVHVYSEAGRGTTFRVYFPAAEVSEEEESEQTGVEGGSERILLVDDEFEILETARAVLTEAGYSVQTAQRASDALRFLENDSPVDLVVTDMMMEELSGAGLAEKIRGRRPETQVMFMSSFPASSLQERGLLGEDALFLPKPFSSGQLLAAVRDSLDHSETPPR